MSSSFPDPCTCPPDRWADGGPHLSGCPQFNILRDGSGFLGSSLTEETGPRSAHGTELDPPVDGKCNAVSKSRPGGRCRKPAGAGTDHLGSGNCKIHGGNTPSGKKHAGKQIAKKARDTFGLPVEIDPAQALLEEVWRTQGHVVWLGLQVQQLKTKNVAWGITKVKTGGDDYGTTQEAKINAFVALYQDERKHLVRVTSEAIKAGVEEKRLTLETHRAELVVNMLGSIFDDLELTDEQAVKLEELVPRALTAIAALEGTK